MRLETVKRARWSMDVDVGGDIGEGDTREFSQL